MSTYRVTDQAQEDLAEIWDAIAEFNENTAESVDREDRVSILSLSTVPGIRTYAPRTRARRPNRSREAIRHFLPTDQRRSRDSSCLLRSAGLAIALRGMSLGHTYLMGGSDLPRLLDFGN